MLLLPILALTMQLPVTNKGSELYAECKTLIAALDAPGRHPGSYDSGECLGYIGGVGDTLMGMKIVCMSHGTMATVARVYIAYMDKNPKLFDEPRSTGLLEAFMEAYPCEKP